MADAALRNLLSTWQGEYQLLLGEASELLRNFDTASASGASELLARRQQIIDRFQNFDTLLKEIGAGEEASSQDLLQEFRAFQQETTKRILELDGLAIALGKERLGLLKGKLDGMRKGKHAFAAYEQSAGVGMRHH